MYCVQKLHVEWTFFSSTPSAINLEWSIKILFSLYFSKFPNYLFSLQGKNSSQFSCFPCAVHTLTCICSLVRSKWIGSGPYYSDIDWRAKQQIKLWALPVIGLLPGYWLKRSSWHNRWRNRIRTHHLPILDQPFPLVLLDLVLPVSYSQQFDTFYG